MLELTEEARITLVRYLAGSLRTSLTLADALDLGLVGIKIDGALAALADDEGSAQAFHDASASPRATGHA